MAVEAAKSRSKIYALAIVLFLAVLSILYYMSAPVYLYIVSYIWFGFAIGGLMQYGRFCFASAWRDLFAIKVPRMFVGAVISVAILSVIAVISFAVYPDRYVFPQLGPGLLIGGAIFGLGMVLAGGCGSGVLYKSGEGHMSAMIALGVFAVTQAIFVSTIYNPIYNVLMKDFPQAPMAKVFFGGDGAGGSYSIWQHLFADTLINSIVIGLVLLVGVYVYAVRKGHLKKRSRELQAAAATTADGGTAKTGFKDELAGFWSMITSSNRTIVVAVLIGLVAGGQMFVTGWMANHYDFKNFGQVLTGNTASGNPAPASWPQGNPQSTEVTQGGTVFDSGYWVMATQITMLSGWAGQKVGLDAQGVAYFNQSTGLPSPWHSPLLLLSLGLVLGSAAMALFSKEFKWKKPTKESTVYALAGGTLLGVGARIGFGCNIGAFYTRAAFGNPGGWVYFLGMGVGAYGATRFVTWMTERKMNDMDFDIEL